MRALRLGTGMSNYWQRMSTRQAVVYVLFVPALFLLDRLSKLLVQKFLTYELPVEVFPFFYLTYVRNTGAAFGVLENQNTFFIVVSIILIAFLLVIRRRLSASGAAVKWGMLMVIGGALGNLYDRLTLDGVVDFLDFRIWPVFNFADSFISVGAGLMAWGMYKKKRDVA